MTSLATDRQANTPDRDDAPAGVVLVVAALDWEAQTARAGAAVAGRDHLHLAVSGIGMPRARIAAERALDPQGPHAPVRAVISIGVAGGLARDLPRPALTVSRRIIRQTDGQAWNTDPDLRRRLLVPLYDTEQRFHETDSLTAPRVLYTRAEKTDALQNAPDAKTVQMEDSEWAQACADAGVPFAAIRVVMDGLNDDIPPETAGWHDAPTPAELGISLIRRPGLLKDLARLGWQRRVALQNLERALTAILPTLRGYPDRSPDPTR